MLRGWTRALANASLPVVSRSPSRKAKPGSRYSTRSPPSSVMAASLRWAASRVTAPASVRLHVTDQLLVAIGLGVEHESFLHRLELVDEEHEHDADQKRDQRRVEREAQGFRDAREIALDRALRLRQRVADAAHRADEADGRDRPGDVADHREIRFEPVRLGIAHGLRQARGVLDAV